MYKGKYGDIINSQCVYIKKGGFVLENVNYIAISTNPPLYIQTETNEIENTKVQVYTTLEQGIVIIKALNQYIKEYSKDKSIYLRGSNILDPLFVYCCLCKVFTTSTWKLRGYSYSDYFVWQYQEASLYIQSLIDWGNKFNINNETNNSGR